MKFAVVFSYGLICIRYSLRYPHPNPYTTNINNPLQPTPHLTPTNSISTKLPTPKMKPQQETEALCKKLKPVIGTQADKLWHMYLSEDELNRKKFAQDIEIIAEKFLKERPLENQQILLLYKQSFLDNIYR